MKYKCEIDKRDGGIWEKKETPKTITFTYIDDLHFEPNYTKIKISKTGKFYGDVLRDWKDGTYTAYPKQCGIPYYFEPLLEQELQ
jgi:hypothetical protein